MSAPTENRPLNIVVWNENVHESRGDATVVGHYPDGMHTVIAAALREHHPEASVGTATLQEPEHGLGAERLAQTDVLFWWGHAAHGEVSDEVVDRVVAAVHAGWASWCCTPATTPSRSRA